MTSTPLEMEEKANFFAADPNCADDFNGKIAQVSPAGNYTHATSDGFINSMSLPTNVSGDMDVEAHVAKKFTNYLTHLEPREIIRHFLSTFRDDSMLAICGVINLIVIIIKLFNFSSIRCEMFIDVAPNGTLVSDFSGGLGNTGTITAVMLKFELRSVEISRYFTQGGSANIRDVVIDELRSDLIFGNYDYTSYKGVTNLANILWIFGVIFFAILTLTTLCVHRQSAILWVYGCSPLLAAATGIFLFFSFTLYDRAMTSIYDGIQDYNGNNITLTRLSKFSQDFQLFSAIFCFVQAGVLLLDAGYRVQKHRQLFANKMQLTYAYLLGRNPSTVSVVKVEQPNNAETQLEEKKERENHHNVFTKIEESKSSDPGNEIDNDGTEIAVTVTEHSSTDVMETTGDKGKNDDIKKSSEIEIVNSVLRDELANEKQLNLELQEKLDKEMKIEQDLRDELIKEKEIEDCLREELAKEKHIHETLEHSLEKEVDEKRCLVRKVYSMECRLHKLEDEKNGVTTPDFLRDCIPKAEVKDEKNRKPDWLTTIATTTTSSDSNDNDNNTSESTEEGGSTTDSGEGSSISLAFSFVQTPIGPMAVLEGPNGGFSIPFGLSPPPTLMSHLISHAVGSDIGVLPSFLFSHAFMQIMSMGPMGMMFQQLQSTAPPPASNEDINSHVKLIRYQDLDPTSDDMKCSICLCEFEDENEKNSCKKSSSDEKVKDEGKAKMADDTATLADDEQADEEYGIPAGLRWLQRRFGIFSDEGDEESSPDEESSTKNSFSSDSSSTSSRNEAPSSCDCFHCRREREDKEKDTGKEEEEEEDTGKDEEDEKASAIAKLPCGHVFHEKCISKWLKIHDSCPVCRKSIKPETSDGPTDANNTEDHHSSNIETTTTEESQFGNFQEYQFHDGVQEKKEEVKPMLYLRLIVLHLVYNLFISAIEVQSPAIVTSIELFNKGVKFHSNQELEKALHFYKQAVVHYNLSEAYLNIGNLLRDKEDVLAHYYLALEHSNEGTRARANAHSNIAFHLERHSERDLKKLNEAIFHLQKALHIIPDHVDAWHNLGVAFEKLGDYVSAAEAYIQVLSLKPSHVVANMNLGVIYHHLGNLELSTSYTKTALEILSETEKDTGKVDEANAKSILNNYGQALLASGNSTLARKMLNRCHDRFPDDLRTIFNLLNVHRKECFWRRLVTPEELYNRAIAAVAKTEGSVDDNQDDLNKDDGFIILPYDATLLPYNNSRIFEVALFRCSEYRPDNRYQRSAVNKASQILKLAYTSYDFRDHAMGYLTEGFLRFHDRNTVQIDVFMYGPNDSSQQRLTIENAVDHRFHDVRLNPDHVTAEKIRGADIMIDLMAHTTGTRLGIGAQVPRPSPLIVNYLGYPGTTGSSFTDYIIADKIVVPALEQKYFSEALAYLPHTYQANYFPMNLTLETGQKEIDELTRAFNGGGSSLRQQIYTEYAFPSETFVFVNFNAIDKMEPTIFGVWMSILRRSPTNAILWLLRPKLPAGFQAMQNLRLEALHHGVNPSRIHFAPRVPKFEHLKRFTAAHLFLDTAIYNGHTTTSDALWQGVPIVTICGQTFQSRVASSLLRSVDMEELITYSYKEYEDLAVRLASEQLILQSLRAKITRHLLRTRTFDTKEITKNLERSYRVMWEGYTNAFSKLKGSNSAMLPRDRHYRLIINPESTVHKPVQNDSMLSSELTLRETLVQAIKKGVYKQTVEGDIHGAFSIYQRILSTQHMVENKSNEKLQFQYAEAWHLLGTVFMDETLGNTGMARHCIRKALKLAPNEPLYHQNFAAVNLGERETIEIATHHINLALRYTPDGSLSHQLLSVVLNIGAFCVDIGQYHLGLRVLNFNSPTSPLPTNLVLPLDLQIRWYRSLAIAFTFEEPQSGRASFFMEKAKNVALSSAHFRNEYSELLLTDGLLQEEMGEYDASLALLEAYVLYENRIKRSSTKRVPNKYDSPRLVIYCNEYGQTWWPQWGPSSLDGGLGGSEEAVVYLSREMANLGYWVEIFANPVDSDLGLQYDNPLTKGSVVWYRYTSFDSDTDDPDVFIAWRYQISAFVSPLAKQRYVWFQDVSEQMRVLLTPKFLEKSVNGIFVLSEFHARQMSQAAQKKDPITGEYLKIIISKNSLNPNHFVDGPHSKNWFIYGSAPNRGLEQVLVSWPILRNAIPHARLDVYYGFSPAFLKWGKTSIPNFDSWLASMKELLKQPGINYHGMVGHEELAVAYSKAGFTLYPTSFPETGCVALMKALALGAIPITSRYSDSTLPELTQHFDLGPHIPEDLRRLEPGAKIANHPQWLKLWQQSVIDAYHRPDKELKDHRVRMINWARRHLVWSNVAEVWHKTFLKNRK
eukprot:g4176.t1